ncbi:hypothetical protein NQ315_014622 [Exocentrus adspersus]|uniref:DUF7041 domain-containing protein n=1 Tax=Exocentrus adspersus TaxID=1586481 RepID=A0AAV8VPQ7_9CUCU|nr:hypothetical protein NQ315_014622 [Exocentrus adspersus]
MLDNAQPATGAPTVEINRVGFKIPPFWQKKKTAMWFTQVEAQFALSKITNDETKFHHIVANLEPYIAEEVGDIIDFPPAQGKYEKIKTELIARLSASA